MYPHFSPTNGLHLQTVGLVSPTPVPFTSVPLGKTTFQLTTSVGRSLQTYDLRRGLHLVFITRPQTPGPITATTSWADKVAAAWSTSTERGVWIYQRGKKTGQLQVPLAADEDVVQLHVFGSWMVACCRTKIEVWSAADGEHYTTLSSPVSQASVLTGGICSMATFPNKIFAGREDGSVEIWNVSTGKLLYRILPPSSSAGPVTAMEPTPALSMLAIAYLDGLLLIRDVRVDKEVIRLRAATSERAPVTSISFRTDGLGAGDDGKDAGVMATASYGSGDVTLWDLNQGGRRVGVLRLAHDAPASNGSGPAGGISGLEFLPGQSVMVTSGLDNALKTWIFDETPFSPLPRLLHARRGHAAPVTTLNFLPSDADGAEAGGKWLLSTSQDRSFWGFSLRRDAQSTELSQGAIQSKAKKMGGMANGHGASPSSNLYQDLKAPEITCLACSLNRDGGMGAMPGVKTLWATAKQLKGKSSETEQNLTGWESVVTGHRGDKFARTWFWGRKRAGRWLLETSDASEVSSVAVSPCGTFALVGSKGGVVDMYNLQSGFPRQRFPARLTPSQARRLQMERAQAEASGSGQDLAPRDGKDRKKHVGAVVGLHVDNLNHRVVSAGAEGSIKFWDFHSGRMVEELDWHAETGITAMRAHRPSDLIALACDDARVRVVDIETQKVIRELSGSKGAIQDLCFSNDGRWIIAASSDAVVRVWDLPTGHLIDAMKLPSQCPALAFSNTGEFLATAQADGAGIDLWSNRTLFSHVPTRHIGEEEISLAAAPTASGEGGRGMLAAAFDEDAPGEAEGDDLLPTLDQLSDNVETLSLVPRSRWQTLLNLDIIRERNKPTEAPKAPEKAPFFLSSLDRKKDDALDSLALATSSTEPASMAERSRIIKSGQGMGESRFTQLIRQKEDAELVDHLKTLAPAAADIEIRSLSAMEPYEDLVGFVRALRQRLEDKRDYELVQAWMAVFLRCHGESVQESHEVQASLQAWRIEQRREGERLGKLASFCSGVVQFLRSAR